MDERSVISPITGPRCPEGSRKLRFPDYVKMTQDGGKVVSLTHRNGQKMAHIKTW